MFYEHQTHLEDCECLHHLGDTVLSDGFCESWPRRRVGELGATGEQGVAALGAHINSYGEGFIYYLIIYIEKRYRIFVPYTVIHFFYIKILHM